MLKFGNKEFRNLQEQVLENMKDIANLQEGTAVLSEFGIKVVGEVDALADLPTVLEYKSDNPDWAYGDAYAVGTEAPYTLYILTRENDTHDEDYWFDIGVFPAPGPQGEQGPKGDQGIQGPTGPSGADGLDAGFGSITATAETLSSGSAATASVTVSGPNTAKELAFTFGIPQNTPAGFTHYITITPNGATSGTLGQSEYNILYDNYDSIIRLRVGSQTINYYFLKKWSVTDDYMRYICLWSVNNDTRYYLITIDRSNRNWTLASGEPFKISQSNIYSGSATNGQVLTADGNGGASWQDSGSGSGLQVVTLTQSTSTLSDDDYNKLNGDNAIIKFVSSADGWTKYFKKYKDDGTYIYYYQVSQEDGNGTFFGGFRIVKSTKYCASLNSYLKVGTSNINSGSTIANQYLTSNGSGGATWTSGPSFTQVQSDWNESSSSSPAFIKNKPSLFSGDYNDLTNKPDLSIYAESADLATVATTGDYDDLLNKPTIPAAQVNSDWDAASGIAQILNKPTLATVATSGSYNDLSGKPTLGTAAAKNFTSSVTSGSADLVTSGAVYTAIDNIPEPMIFKGSLGTGGTITDLPTASSANEGFVYKVITDGTYASQAAKVGDTFVSDGSAWILIPSGDEPSGTVMSVGVSVPTGLTVSNTPITSSGTIAIGLDTGYVIPTQASLDNYVTTDTVQNITNLKSFRASTEFRNTVEFYDTNTLQSTIETPYAQGSQLVGFSGMKSTSSTYKLAIPSTSSYTADKTIATTDDIPTSASSSSTSTSTVTPTTGSFVTGITPTTDTWTFALSDGTSVQKTVVLGVTPTTGNAMTGATVATTTTTTTTLS